MKNSIVFNLLAAIAFISVLASCHKEESAPSTVYFSDEELAEIKESTCLTIMPDDFATTLDDTPPTGAIEERATGMKNKFWSPGSTLRVKFLGGNSTLQNKVMQYAEQWEQFANINFVKVTSGTAEIRVAFDAVGSFSYIGKDNLGIVANQKTMNLDLASPSTSEAYFKSTVIHEFGHALGLGHEQQSPLSSIPWNVPAVYAFYAQMGWPQQQVNQNVLNKYQWTQTQHTSHDAQSIMQYPVSASLTTNGFSIPMNTQLSATDKDFIGKIYSNQKIKVRHAANVSFAITFWLNGIYHTIQPGESLWVPAKTTGNQLSIWECPNGNCSWDGYAPPYGYNYKIVSQGSNGNLTLAYD
ncbi:MAG: hypothetical protein K9J37_14410 [Saprospiraceae bacterium]|nr:hypothetical protein [Saprospiraceae bacterium]MCF8251100.1 hypothetical protein [Saprospiraceae bacterium]MCF8281002.1 hypothetical protein [Bacteroidales bacterium]MCF8312942.1 hypothetical protein [Saprospiraceae bacterium]MCF8441359.1 hypothetical protein [Saprospiraceae bacterium]